jgi:predicted PurR-regulated permease PerM
MIENNSSIPFYVKLSQVTIGIIGLIFILYVGQEIIIPLLFSLIVAILLNPAVNFLTRKGLNRILAITITVVLSTILILGLLFFIGSQLSMFSEALPQLKQKFTVIFNDGIAWVSQNFNTSPDKVRGWIETQKKESISNSTAVIGQTLNTISGLVVIVLLIPVYIFLILFYKPLLLEFIDRIFPANKDGMVKEVLTETKTLIQSYLIGLLIEAAIVAALNSTALFIIGIDYALLIGIIGALLNLIPYIGGVIAIAIPMILALATKEPIDALYVMIAYLGVQIVDNNFIVPKIVASKVKINALASIVVVLIGGALWGVAGMFLSLPLTAIFKVIFDRIEPLKPLGFLIGDNMPDITIFGHQKKNKK